MPKLRKNISNLVMAEKCWQGNWKIILARLIGALEGSHSGLVHRLGKAAYRKVSWVRIPPPPQKAESPLAGVFGFSWWDSNRSRTPYQEGRPLSYMIAAVGNRTCLPAGRGVRDGGRGAALWFGERAGYPAASEAKSLPLAPEFDFYRQIV